MEVAGMFMKTPYMISGLSLPTEELKSSLSVCLFSVSIAIRRIDVELAADVLGILIR